MASEKNAQQVQMAIANLEVDRQQLRELDAKRARRDLFGRTRAQIVERIKFKEGTLEIMKSY
jgi:hypothetical protein